MERGGPWQGLDSQWKREEQEDIQQRFFSGLVQLVQIDHYRAVPTNDRRMWLALEVGNRLNLSPTHIGDAIAGSVRLGLLDEEWTTIGQKIHRELQSEVIPTFPVHAPTAPTSVGWVFLSYASEDRARVQYFDERLAHDGIPTWFDARNLQPGYEWETAILDAIQKSVAVVVFLSRSSSKRGYVQKEMAAILEQATRVPVGTVFAIPALLEECEVPQQLSKWQSVNLWPKDGYPKLQRVLSTAIWDRSRRRKRRKR